MTLLPLEDLVKETSIGDDFSNILEESVLSFADLTADVDSLDGFELIDVWEQIIATVHRTRLSPTGAPLWKGMQIQLTKIRFRAGLSKAKITAAKTKAVKAARKENPELTAIEVAQIEADAETQTLIDYPEVPVMKFITRTPEHPELTNDHTPEFTERFYKFYSDTTKGGAPKPSWKQWVKSRSHMVITKTFPLFIDELHAIANSRIADVVLRTTGSDVVTDATIEQASADPQAAELISNARKVLSLTERNFSAESATFNQNLQFHNRDFWMKVNDGKSFISY
jgi:hypothetical protein